MVVSETRYARAPDGTFIAYRVAGEGELDVLWVPPWLSHVEIDWEWPASESFLARLSRLGRVVVFDKRGTGLSDRPSGVPDLETRASDALAVLDAVGSSRALLFGEGLDGTALCTFLASSQPERVRAIALISPAATAARADDYPWGQTVAELEAERLEIPLGWGREDHQQRLIEINFGPDLLSYADDPAFLRFEARWQRYTASPGAAVEFDRVWASTDVRAVLDSVRVPALVLLRESWPQPEVARYVAERMPSATLEVVPGRTSVMLEDSRPVVEAIGRFLDGLAPPDEVDVVLRAVLFTDIQASTERAAMLGDRAWKDLVEQHHATVRAALDRYAGVEVDTAGDGFFATFEGPARAVRCGQEIISQAGGLGIAVRAGVHTGEYRLIDGKPGGLAVVIGARIAALASPGEVLVSQTVKDLTAGSGLEFEPRGSHRLKGVPGEWQLYRAG